MRHVARRPAGPLRGALFVPGDKSISHRAVLFAAMAEGTSLATGVLDAADVRSTIAAVGSLGAGIEVVEEGPRGLGVKITGWGSMGPVVGRDLTIDCGNSGTTARLLLGVLAGWPCEVTLVGDVSLSRRPMGRVTEPLGSMGARFTGDPASPSLPLTIVGSSRLTPITYASPVASAQVKSAVLLAGVRADGRTTVSEPAFSRDHTERMLPAFGVPVGTDSARRAAWVDGPCVPRATNVSVPGDPSSAAFVLGASLIVPGSEIVVRRVSLNPTRTGFLAVLSRMGANVVSAAGPALGTEPVGDITARTTGAMHGTVIKSSEVPALIDEVPLLAVVATQAEGTTRFEGVGELRVKESDRLAAVAEGLTSMGATVRAGDDWLEVDGPARLGGAVIDSLGDHRLAMAFAVAGLAAEGEVAIDRFEAIDVSYPRFAEDLAAVAEGEG